MPTNWDALLSLNLLKSNLTHDDAGGQFGNST